MKSIPTSSSCRTFSPRSDRSGRRWFDLVLSTVIPAVVSLLALTSSAQTPAPPAGGTPSADQLQAAYNRGRSVGIDTAYSERIEVNGKFADAPKDLLREKLDDYVKEHGSQWSEAEKEVFSEAYWKGAKAQNASFGNMTSVQPDLEPSNTPTPITTVSGKTPTPDSGTLQLTDKDGNSYFVDVDANGNYKKTIPQADFRPVKATLWTKNGKLVRTVRSDGTWVPISSSNVTPGGANVGDSAAYALLDECNRTVIASRDSEIQTVIGQPHDGPPRSQSSIHLVRLFGSPRPAPYPERPPVHLVGESLPPDVVDQMNKLGKDIADYEHQKETLEKELRENKDAKTGKRLDRDEFKQKETELDNVKNKLKSAEQNKQFISDDARKVAEDAYKARKAQYALPEQIRQLRAKGDPASLQQADMMERQLQALNQFYGPIALAPIIVPAGQSGYALANTTASLASGNTPQVVKGHTTQVATADIRRQQETGIELDPLVHLEENERNETVSFPSYFGYNLSTQSWGKPNFSLAAIWTGSDPNPPVVASIASDDTFTIKNTYGLKACVKLNVAYGYDHVSTAIDGTNLAGDYHVTFNRNPTWIAGFKTGVNIDQFQQDYMQGGAVNHSQYTWTHWHTPFPDVPMISSGQISDEGYNHLSWTKPYKDFMVYGELNPGTNPDPLPGLDTTDWPSAAAAPLPALSLPGSWLEEGGRR